MHGDRGLDDAGTVGVGAGRQRRTARGWRAGEAMARTARWARWLRPTGAVRDARPAACRAIALADERAQLLLGHSCHVHGVDDADDRGIDRRALRPSASPAARPSMTISTFSCTPAPTRVHGEQRRAARLCRRASPAAPAAAWRPRTSGASAWRRRFRRRGQRHGCIGSSVPVIDDADDAGVGRHLGRVERKARFLAAHEEHRLADAGADGVDRHERPPGRQCRRRRSAAGRAASRREVLVLPRDDDVADDPGELHAVACATTSTASTMPTMAASTGQSFMPAAMRAELPLTMSTVSPTPASTVSTATR